MIKSKPKTLLILCPICWPKLPPLGIGCLQAYLLKNSFPVEILDLNNIFYHLMDANLQKEWLKSCNLQLENSISEILTKDYSRDFENQINKILDCDILGFSCFKSNFDTTVKIARILKSKKPNLRVIFGGPEITRLSFKTNNKFKQPLTSLADSLVVGEGERPLLEFINNGTINKIYEFNELDNLEDSIFPKYQGIDLNSYPRKKAISLIFSRGCVRKCKFCSERLLYKKFRTRSIEGVINEIAYHRENNGIEYFIFHDSMLNADIKRLDKLTMAIISNFGSINWEAQIGIRDDMDKNIFRKMKQSGCCNLFVGLESGSDTTLKNMNKGFNTKQALSFFQKLNAAGLSFGISIIVGFPNETDADFYESLNFILKNRNFIPKIEQINPYVYYDGTDADKTFDYQLNKKVQGRFNILVNEIKKSNIKHTNAFLGNLIRNYAN